MPSNYSDEDLAYLVGYADIKTHSSHGSFSSVKKAMDAYSQGMEDAAADAKINADNWMVGYDAGGVIGEDKVRITAIVVNKQTSHTVYVRDPDKEWIGNSYTLDLGAYSNTPKWIKDTPYK